MKRLLSILQGFRVHPAELGCQTEAWGRDELFKTVNDVMVNAWNDERRSRIRDVDTSASHEIVNLSIIVGEWNIAMVQLRTSQNRSLIRATEGGGATVTVPIFICAASYSYGAIESTAKRNAAYIVKVASLTGEHVGKPR